MLKIKKPIRTPDSARRTAARKRLDVCLVTHDLLGWSEPTDTGAAIAGLAQLIAAKGDGVTLLWVPHYSDVEALAGGEAVRLEKYYAENYLIRLKVLMSSRHLSPYLSDNAKQSAAVYYYLKEEKFDAVYFALEGGSAYYALLGKELSLFEPRPQLYVIAHAPIEWRAESDRHFLKDLQQVTVAHMEKYCVSEADALICPSSYLPAWMKSKGWKLPQKVIKLPNLRPAEWIPRNMDIVNPTLRRVEEIVYLNGPDFRHGLTLFCDALDVLARKSTSKLSVTMLGRLGRILGEHSGGMLLRRARSWPFEIKILPGFTERESIEYLKRRNCLVVVPCFAADTPMIVSTCLEEGIRFVAIDTGGIAEMIVPSARTRCLSGAISTELAETIAHALNGPFMPVAPAITAAAKRADWEQHFDAVAARDPKSVPRKSRARNKLPKVSVVMVHHDRPQYLPQAIDAVERQDYPNLELILVDDGSKLPESRALLDELAPRFKKRGWKILLEKNRYLGAARNAGVKASKGERILFVDDDNALFERAVSTYVKAMDASGSDICTSFQKIFHEPFVPVDEKYGYIQYFPPGGSLDLGFIHDSFGDANAMIRRDVFDKIGFQIEDYGYTAQDWEFFSRAVLGGLKLRVIPEPLYWYRSSAQGMYRTSHWYDNRLPIMKAFKKHNYAGLDHLYHLVMSAYVIKSETEGFRENLNFSISDERYLQLTGLEPDSDEAYELLAEIAASEGRSDTALTLLGRCHKPGYRKRVIERVSILPLADQALAELGAEFSSEVLLDLRRLREFSVSSTRASDPAPVSYIEDRDKFFIPAENGVISVAVLAAGCPAGANRVSATISLEQAITVATEFLILLTPTHVDPLLAARQAKITSQDGSSGWCNVTYPHESRQIEANLSIPADHPLNLILAVRVRDEGVASSLGCFSRISLRQTLGAVNARRPRIGPPPGKQRTRLWTRSEMKSAKLLHHYRSQLPMLMFPPDDDGVFLRPSEQGVVAASLAWAFPPFARKVIASVEVTHEESSPFEFAIALTRPLDDIEWVAEVPSECVAFSGWLRVEDKFQLHQLFVEVREVLRTHLHINLAIRLPPGSVPSPANAYWRKLVLVWDE